jgi:hypothetical protein
MSRFNANIIVISLACLTLTGCAYDRSFMQMDSNSGVPFFGLQWAVDSGIRPSSHDETSRLSIEGPDAPLAVPNPRVDRKKADRRNPSPEIISVSLRDRL